MSSGRSSPDRMENAYNAPGPSRLAMDYTYDPAESPMIAGTDVYGGSASGVMESDNEAADYFVGVREESEVEHERRPSDGGREM